MTATTSLHLSKPASTDLTIKPDSVLTIPIGKDGGAKLVDVKYLPNKNLLIFFLFCPISVFILFIAFSCLLFRMKIANTLFSKFNLFCLIC